MFPKQDVGTSACVLATSAATLGLVKLCEMQPAVALPIRDIPKKQIEAWIARDEAEMAAFRASTPKTKKK